MQTIGGQAVIEGVLMLSKKKIAVSVRKEDGHIETKVEERHPLATKFKDIIFFRGIISLIEMLYIGTKALMWSTDQSLDEEEKLTTWQMTLTLLISFGIGIALFIILPLYLAKLVSDQHVIFNLVDGVLRVIIFIGYLLLISMMKDIQRVFQYHGAEHMAVHCYEAKKPLTTKNVRSFTTLHPRCGTAFLIIVLILSIILFSFIWSDNWFLKFAFRILLIPLIASVSYEILKFSAKHQHTILFKLLITPGLWFQKITTKKPDDKQIEVAIVSLKAVLK